MAYPDSIIGAAPEPSIAGLTPAETIDLVESWLRAEPDMRLGKAHAQGQRLGVEVTRRHFFEAKRRLGITSSVAPQPDRRAAETPVAKPAEPATDQPPAAPVPALPKAQRRPRVSRKRPVNLADLSNLAENFEAIIAERDRARAALEEIRLIVKALR